MKYIGVVSGFCLITLSTLPLLADSPDTEADFTITTRLVATNTPPIGINELGDPGGTSFSAGNLIPDSGFEPISIRRYWRTTRTGSNWMELDGGGVTDWHLVQSGYLSGADVRIYRLVDANGDPLPFENGSLDLTEADRFIKVREGRVIPPGAPDFPLGGWVATQYAQPAKVWGTRSSLSFTDAQWVDNGTTYYYTVTAVSDGSATSLSTVVESDPATTPEIAATPQSDSSGGPRIFCRDGDSFTELQRVSAGNWMSFKPGVANATGTVLWSLLDEQDQPQPPPEGLRFIPATGELSGSPTTTPAETILRFRVSADNGTATRDFMLNPPLWTPSGNTTPPAPPQNLQAESGDGYVHLTWDPSPSTNVVGYRVYRSTSPRVQQVERVYLEGDGPAPAPGDYLMVNLRTNQISSSWSHPRVRNINGTVSETWGNAGWGTEVEFSRDYHSPGLPPEFRFPGETCLKINAISTGGHAINGPVIFYPRNESGEALWYSQLEADHHYHYEVWLRQEGLGNSGQVTLGFQQLYTDIQQTFTVTSEWQKYSFDFVAPPPPTTGSHGMPKISFTGPGVLWMDNIRLFRFDADDQRTADFVPSPMMFDELMSSQPPHGPKGVLRSMGVMLNTSSMPGNLSYHRDAKANFNWYQSVGAPSSLTLPFFLETALRTGTNPPTRMQPWLNIPSFTTESEWLQLLEYLSAPINPDDPADVAAKPFAYLRFQQRGVATPWTDEFTRIILEFANETWHNRSVSDLWWGWGSAYAVHQGGVQFGHWARYITDTVTTQSPYWITESLDNKLQFVMGSNYSDYAEKGLPLAPRVSAIGHTTYVGPKWETGETPNAAFTDHGVQGTLLGYVASVEDSLDSYRRQREALALQGVHYEILGYEGGPSGYSLPGTASADQVEISELYGKSLAMGVAALDAWLGSHEHGFTDNAEFAFSEGAYWTSHTLIKDGFRPHSAWLALTLRNRYASGQLVRVHANSTPTLAWDGTDRPLIGCYAFRDHQQLSIFVLSRKLDGAHDGYDFGDGSTPVTLRLPAAPAGTGMLHKLTGDPRSSNRDALNLAIESEPVTLASTYTFSMPAGSIYLFTVPTGLAPSGTIPSTPPDLSATFASGGITLSWAPAPDATGYRIYRSVHPAFAYKDVSLEQSTDITSFLDTEAVGGTTYYYRVSATNSYGESPFSLVAVGGTNTSTALLEAPEILGIGEGDAQLRIHWTPVADATGYRVGTALQPGGPYTWHEAGNNTELTMNGLDNARPYATTVYAYSDTGRSANANDVLATPHASSAEQALAAWELSSLTSYEPSAAVAHYALGLEVSALNRAPGLIAGNVGYHPLPGAFGFIPNTDNGNFGAPEGGSLENAIDRDLYLTFAVTPEPGTRVSISKINTGALHPYSSDTFFLQFAFLKTEGPIQLAHPTPITIQQQTQNPTNVEIDTSSIPELQNVTGPIEFQIYFFSTYHASKWCRAGLRRSSGEDLVVSGTISPATPQGRLAYQPGIATLSWTEVPGFTLQFSTNLNTSSGWNTWPGIVSTENGQAQTLIPTDLPSCYFRWIQL